MVDPIKIDTFGGEVPAIDDRLLPPNSASECINAWLFSGRIEPLHSLVPVYTMSNPDNRGFFRVPKGPPGIDYMTNSYWLEFADPTTRPIRSPIAQQDDDGRYYWADGVAPKMMTGTMIETGATPYLLGVPPPEVAPGVSATGGSAGNKTVNYVYTWVTANGEEGPPSPPTQIIDKIDATYTITMTAPTTADTTNRNLTHTRIYRTVVGAQGAATFFFVTELPITTLTYVDDCMVNTDAVIVNNETLPSLYWTAPPADLQQLVSMPNGMIAGFRAHGEVWFCEPYHPHAWPVTYVIAIDQPIVGLGVIDQSLILLTEGQPYAATGVDPSAMALSKIQPIEPCTSITSIVNTPGGVLYCSPNGLINITPAGAENLTLKMITRDEWANMLNLPSVAAAILSQGYQCYSLSQPGVFQTDTFQTDAFQQDSEFGTLKGAYISLGDPRISVTRLDPAPANVQNMMTDLFSGEVLQLRDGVVYVVDLRKFLTYAPYTWRSKIFAMPYPTNFGAAKVYYTPAYAGPTSTTIFRVYAGLTADDIQSGLQVRFEERMTQSGMMFRLPSGYKAIYYQFEVEGNAVIDAIHAAETPRQLRAV